jgi:general stress protein CsbA
VAYFIDGCLLLVILFTVLTIGQWAAMVELAARRFLGY